MNFIGLIFISGVLGALYWFVFYNHGGAVKAEAESLRQEIVASDKTLDEKKRKLKELVEFDDSVKQMGKELELFLNYIPQKLTTLMMYEDLTRIAQECSIDLKDVKNSQLSKGVKLYETLTVNLTIEGEFSNFLIFLSKLTELDKIVMIDNIQLRPVSNAEKGSSQKITAQLNLSGFRYSAPATPQNENSSKNKKT